MDSSSPGGRSVVGGASAPGMVPTGAGQADIRASSLVLPTGIDADWFRWTLDLTPRQVREIHERRMQIAAFSGYAWPRTRPGEEELPALFADGARWPLFTRAVARAAASAIPNLRKRSEFRLFKPEFSTSSGKPLSDKVLEGLLESRDGLYVRDRLLTAAMTYGISREALETARDAGRTEIDAVMPFLDAMSAAVDAVDWERDCLGLSPRPAPVPARPPATRSPVSAAAAGATVPPPSAAAAQTVPATDAEIRKEPVFEAVQPPLPEPASLPLMGDKPSGRQPEPPQASEMLQVDLADAPEIPPLATPLLPDPQAGALLQSSRARWDTALSAVARAAAQIGRGRPDARALGALLPRIQEAEAAERAWQAAMPPLVETRPLLQQIAALAERALPMAGSGAAWPPRGWNPAARIDEAALATVANGLAPIAAAVGEAEAERSRAVDLMRQGDLSALEEVNARVKAAETGALAVIAALHGLVQTLRTASGAAPGGHLGTRREAEAPSPSEVWWGLPGPSSFLAQAVREAVGDGLCLLELPPHLPADFLPALERWAGDQHGYEVVHAHLPLPSHGDRAGVVERLFRAIGIEQGEGDITTLLESPDMEGRLVLVSGISPDDWPVLRAALSEWGGTRRAGGARAGLLVAVPLQVPRSEREIEGVANLGWKERVTRSDTLSFAERALGWPGPTLVERVALGVVVELSAWDRNMAEWLAQFDMETLLDPVGELREGLASHPEMPPEWNAGGADLWDGRWHVHVAALVSGGDIEALHNRVWRAQVREVFPFVDTVRAAFRRKYRASLAAVLPMSRSFSGREVVYAIPERLELTEIASILRPQISAPELELLVSAQALRCSVAHYTPGTATQIKEISDLWEDLSDGTHLHETPGPRY